MTPNAGSVELQAGTAHRRRTAISSAITGTIYTATTVSVISEKRWDEPFTTTAQVMATIVVLWLAHGFADGMARRAVADRADSQGDHGIVEDLRESFPIILASLPQLAPMVLVGWGVFDYETGLWISFGVAIVVLGAWGLLIGRHRGRGPLYTSALVSMSIVLGLMLVSLKEFVH